MVFKNFFTGYILIPVILFCGCVGGLNQKKISEGTITFQITYPNTEGGNLLAGMLPDEMVLKFKHNNILTEFNAGMGLIKIVLIANADSGKISQLLKIMNKKYVYSVDSSRANEFYEDLPEMNFSLTDETKEIAGYKCKKVIVTFKDKLKNAKMKEKLVIYFTDEIDVSKPNWCTPFNKIHGVMLEYEIVKYNIEMKFTAKSVVPAQIDSTEFFVPSDYVYITKEEMDKLFESFKQSI